MLVTGISPLRAFIYKEGLARFATVPYQGTKNNNLNNLFMHLTNYAINKESSTYEQNKEEHMDMVGHKRSLTAVMRQIDEIVNEQRGAEQDPPISDNLWQ